MLHINDAIRFLVRDKTALTIAGGTWSLRPGKKGLGKSDLSTMLDGIATNDSEIAQLFSSLIRPVAYVGASEELTFQDLDNVVHDIEDSLNHHELPELMLVTTGTDAMEQVARYIDAKLGSRLKELDIKLIVTGANRDLTKKDTDFWNNISLAFESGINKDIIPGVYIAFANQLVPAELAVKEPFNGIEMNFVRNDDEHLVIAERNRYLDACSVIEDIKHEAGRTQEFDNLALPYSVNVIRENHDDFLRQVEQKKPKAVLFTLYHSGTAHTKNPKMSVAKLAETLRKQYGIVSFSATENDEPHDLHAYESSNVLIEYIVPLYNMWQSVGLGKLKLFANEPPQEMIDQMLTNYAGEIDPMLIKWEDIEKIKEQQTNLMI